MDDAVWPDKRAGWWRRALALIIDGLCIAISSAIIGAILFAVTGGYLQWSGPGLQLQTCAPVTSIPANLDPPPPPNSDGVKFCRFYSVAGQTGQILTVARATRDNGGVRSVFRTYMRSVSGEAGGYDLSWITWVSLLALLIGSEWLTGTTPGKRLLGLRVISSQDPEKHSVPLKLIAIRYGVALGVMLVPIMIAIVIGFISAVLLRRPPPFVPIIFTVIFMTAICWMLWNTIRIIRRSPAIYDHIARLEVIHTQPLSTSMRLAPAAPGPA